MVTARWIAGDGNRFDLVICRYLPVQYDPDQAGLRQFQVSVFNTDIVMYEICSVAITMRLLASEIGKANCFSVTEEIGIGCLQLELSIAERKRINFTQPLKTPFVLRRSV